MVNYRPRKTTTDNPLKRLVQVDVERKGNIDDIVVESWKELSDLDDGKLFDEIQDTYPTPYNKASKLLRHEFSDDYDGETNDQLKLNGFLGYSDYYLRCRETNFDQDIINQLIEIDLEVGNDIDDFVSTN